MNDNTLNTAADATGMALGIPPGALDIGLGILGAQLNMYTNLINQPTHVPGMIQDNNPYGYARGGSLDQQLSSNATLIQGNPNVTDGNVRSVEGKTVRLDHNEVVASNTIKGTYALSPNLINPETGNTLAKDGEKIQRVKGKAEKYLKDNPKDPFAMNTKEFADYLYNKLVLENERQLQQNPGIKQVSDTMYMRGGNVPGYQGGGGISPSMFLSPSGVMGVGEDPVINQRMYAKRPQAPTQNTITQVPGPIMPNYETTDYTHGLTALGNDGNLLNAKDIFLQYPFAPDPNMVNGIVDSYTPTHRYPGRYIDDRTNSDAARLADLEYKRLLATQGRSAANSYRDNYNAASNQQTVTDVPTTAQTPSTGRESGSNNKGKISSYPTSIDYAGNPALGIPKTTIKTRDFQQWLKDNGYGKELGKAGVDGKFGPKTKAAWDKYGTAYAAKTFGIKDLPALGNTVPDRLSNTTLTPNSVTGPTGTTATEAKTGSKKKLSDIPVGDILQGIAALSRFTGLGLEKERLNRVPLRQISTDPYLQDAYRLMTANRNMARSYAAQQGLNQGIYANTLNQINRIRTGVQNVNTQLQTQNDRLNTQIGNQELDLNARNRAAQDQAIMAAFDQLGLVGQALNQVRSSKDSLAYIAQAYPDIMKYFQEGVKQYKAENQ